MKEVWRPIPNFGGYEVSDLGRVRSFRMGKVKLLLSKDRINLRKNGKTYYTYVCCLVAFTFIGPKPKGQMVRHLDDIRSNNKLKNISYGTMQDNADDARRNKIIVGRPRLYVWSNRDQKRGRVRNRGRDQSELISERK